METENPPLSKSVALSPSILQKAKAPITYKAGPLNSKIVKDRSVKKAFAKFQAQKKPSSGAWLKNFAKDPVKDQDRKN